mmetsp:Transcript_65180/g.180119  ORF Transcript_65180/g.180119 Transcript_65180/m.180119 type:complete len:187 (+) Transcript_65180:109-669(+)
MEYAARFEVGSAAELFEDADVDSLATPPPPAARAECGYPPRGGPRGGACAQRSSASGAGAPAGYGERQAVDVDTSVAGVHAVAAKAPAGAAAAGSSHQDGRRGGGLASRGSACHWVGNCIPCKYLRSKRGCIKGEACEFCHLLHEDVGYTSARRMMRASAERRRGDADSSESSSSSAGAWSGSSST